jgi:fermentation-respiration switch protein FrsA (DUF1100 family)
MSKLIRTPADIDLDYHNVTFSSSDGTLLHGWFLPAQGKPRGSVLFMHGNAENISTHIGSVYWLPAQGYNVLLFDYRGYGRSEGVAEMHGVYRDAQAALLYFDQLPDTQGLPLFVFGQSIGAAIAITTVATSPIKDRVTALIAESSFSSYHKIVRDKAGELWFTWPFQYPISWTFSDRYSPDKFIADISPVPLLLVHSRSDRIIPYNHSEALYEIARQPKELWLTDNGGHLSVNSDGEQRGRLLEYLNKQGQRASD